MTLSTRAEGAPLAYGPRRWLERDFKLKETAYLKAKDAVEAARARKAEMTEGLALMVLSSEKRKEEKLSELLAKMADGTDSEGPTDEQLLG